MKRLGFVFLGLLMLFTHAPLFASEQAAVAVNQKWIEVLQDNDSGMEILLRLPQSLDWSIPPNENLRSFMIAVPGSRGATVSIHNIVTREVASKPTTNTLAAYREFGREVVEAIGVSVLRRRSVLELAFRPWVVTVGGLAEVRQVVVTIRYQDRVRLSGATLDPTFYKGLLNVSTASRWQLPVPQRQPIVAAPLPATRLRVPIPATGIYSLRYEDLLAAGVPVFNPAFDPATFQIFFDAWRWIPLDAETVPSSWQDNYEMDEVAIWVQGAENGSFDPGDRIVFYALGPGEYDDLTGVAANMLAHHRHPYERDNYAWLVWAAPGAGGTLGRRMATQDAAPNVGETQFETSALQRQHFEKDQIYTFIDDGWAWEEVTSTRPASVALPLDLGSASSVAGTVHVNVGGAISRASVQAFDFRLQNSSQLVGPIRSIWKKNATPDDTTFTYNVTLQATNDLRLDFVEGPVNYDGRSQELLGNNLLLKVDVTWDRPLQASQSRLRWFAVPPTATQNYEVLGFTTEPIILDVGDPLRPVRLVNPTSVGVGSSTRWRFTHGKGIGTKVFYEVATSLRSPAVSSLQLRQVSALRDRASAPEMLIVSHSSLIAEAQRLADHRRNHFRGNGNLEILVVDAEDIYMNFSGGRMDPFAIRNYVKHLYRLDAVPRLRFLLLVGDATHDPRRLLLGSVQTLVPTAHHRYADARIRLRSTLEEDYAVEDYLVEMDSPGGRNSPVFTHAVPDLAVGRLTVRDARGAREMIDKIIGFDLTTDFAPWRTRVILLADDEIKPSGRTKEREHIQNTERLVVRTPTEWDLEKIYLTEFPRVLGQKPQARSALIQAWSQGAAWLNYQGHGAPRQIADEVFFLATDVPALSNGGRLPLFTAFSCTVSEFDAPDLQSMAEDLVSSIRGGAIATMGATTPTFSSQNSTYNNAVWDAAFADGVNSKVPFGIMHLQAKNGPALNSRRNSETYMIIGDPSQVLLSPEYVIVFTEGAGSLSVGTQAHIAGEIRQAQGGAVVSDFNGSLRAEVFASADESGYTSPSDPGFHIAYDLLGESLYRGDATVTDGRFSFDFVVPVDARLGAKGRIQAYAFSGNKDAKGGVKTVNVVDSGNHIASTGPPQIRLFFPNNLTRVKSGTELQVEIQDENGINIQGANLRSSILLDFDDSNQPLNVTARFSYRSGSAILGGLSIAIPEDLPAGPHKATLIASDNLRNTSNKDIQFEIVEPGVSRLTNVIAFPNPFADETHFFFELTDPSTVNVRVYTLSGRLVWRGEKVFSEPAQGSLVWRGVTTANHEVANGTYLYRLEALPKDSRVPPLRHMGKVVVMRN